MTPLNSAIKEVPFANFIKEFFLVWEYREMQTFEQEKANWKFYFDSIGLLVSFTLVINLFLIPYKTFSFPSIFDQSIVTVQILVNELLYSLAFSVSNFFFIFKKLDCFKQGIEEIGILFHQNLRLSIFLLLPVFPLISYINTIAEEYSHQANLLYYLVIVFALFYGVLVIRTILRSIFRFYPRLPKGARWMIASAILLIGVSFVAAVKQEYPLISVPIKGVLKQV